VIEDVDLDLARGEVLAVVGESGCGKSTLGRAIAGLLPAHRGTLALDGVALPAALEDRSRAQLRRIQIAFQMADTALNPRLRVGDIIGRPLEFYLGLRGRARRDRVAELLTMVELPAELAGRAPASLSGGQKQRVNLARALAANPEVIVCDEVTSALDTIVSARVLALLDRLRAETGVALVFISHDLSAVAGFADRVAVLYAGRIVEVGGAHEVLTAPRHPYTQLLAASVPQLRPGWLEGAAQAPDTQPAAVPHAGRHRGCAFHARCPQRLPGLCDVRQPPGTTQPDGRKVACHALEHAALPSSQHAGKVLP
jgi:peptide/nickel transport system ATP-binding protein